MTYTLTELETNGGDPREEINEVQLPEIQAALNDLLASIEPAFATLVDGATITWDFGNKPVKNAVVTINGNRTLAITNCPDGARGTLHVIQGAGAPYELTYPAGSLFPSGSALDLADVAGEISVLGFRKRGSNYYWTAIKVMA